MQGWENLFHSKKIDYINALMEVGFDVLDWKFRVAKSHSQMADTKDVIPKFRKK